MQFPFPLQFCKRAQSNWEQLEPEYPDVQVHVFGPFFFYFENKEKQII